MNILICGLPGSGKSQLLMRLKEVESLKTFTFIDLDDEIFARNKIDESHLGQWIDTVGWAEFRKCERETLEELLDNSRQIICLGGGALTEEFLQFYLGVPNIQFIWLECTPEESWMRIRGDATRPLVKRGYEQVLAILRERDRLGKKIPVRISQDEQITQVIRKLNVN